MTIQWTLNVKEQTLVNGPKEFVIRIVPCTKFIEYPNSQFHDYTHSVAAAAAAKKK